MAATVTASSDISNWSTSYAEFFARSTARSVETLKLYQQVMESIALGRLPPTAFQDYLPRFAQLHSAEYSTKLAQVGAAFLSDLMGIGAEPAAAAREPEIPAPRFDSTNPARWFEQLAEYGGQLNARALRTYRAQLDRVAAGESTPMEEQQATSAQLTRELPVYLERLTKLYLDLLNRLTEVRADNEEAYFRGLLANVRSNERRHPDVVLHLAAPAGTVATAELSITNTTGENTPIHYLVGDVRRVDGQGPAFHPQISIAPENVELAPGEEVTVAMSLRLNPRDYDSGALYSGGLLISGNPGLRVEVQLRITATSAQPLQTASAVKEF